MLTFVCPFSISVLLLLSSQYAVELEKQQNETEMAHNLGENVTYGSVVQVRKAQETSLSPPSCCLNSLIYIVLELFCIVYWC